MNEPGELYLLCGRLLHARATAGEPDGPACAICAEKSGLMGLL